MMYMVKFEKVGSGESEKRARIEERFHGERKVVSRYRAAVEYEED